MKTRQGFVSNSSSCSFFVSLKDFKNTNELALHMIEDRLKKFDAKKGSKRYEDEKKRKEQLLQFLKEVKENENLAFKSHNFDTFIIKINIKDAEGTNYIENREILSDKEYLYVSTTNNLQWNINKCCPNGFNSGDCYDGLYDHVFIEGQSFLVLDDMKRIQVDTEPFYCQSIESCKEIKK